MQKHKQNSFEARVYEKSWAFAVLFMEGIMKAYMAVDNTIFELPLFVGDNLGELAELAEWCGWSKAVTSSRISDNRNGYRLGFKLVRIELVDDEDEWEDLTY